MGMYSETVQCVQCVTVYGVTVYSVTVYSTYCAVTATVGLASFPVHINILVIHIQVEII